jgi:spore coat protein U-like protein
MNNFKSIQIVLLFTLLLMAGIAHSQESTNTSGGEATGGGGSVSYSVGQVVYTTNSGSSGTVAQGVQHAYEISVVGVNNTQSNISLNAYPNPATDVLTLQISNYNNEKLMYQLYDLNGKLISSEQIGASQTQINTATLPTATYFIDVLNQENKKVQSFKILKK